MRTVNGLALTVILVGGAILIGLAAYRRVNPGIQAS